MINNYIDSGLNVLPTNSTKMPALKTWKHLQTQFISEEEKKLFKTAHGVAVICGKISGGLEVLDFDNHQKTAKQNISDYFSIPEVKNIKHKYNLCIEISVGGGYHVFYRCEKVGGNKKLASVPIKVNDKWKPDAIIETRGEGGYVIVAPTPGYKVLSGSLELIETITFDDREILLEHAKCFNRWNTERKTDFEETERPGDVYNKDLSSIFEAKQLLISEGWENVFENKWRRPGKKSGISATFGVVAENIFYNFTANGHPFEEGKAYTPFQILALLHYNGDFQSAAKELSKRYEKKTEPKIEIIETKENKNKILEKLFNTRKIDFSKEYKAPTPYLSIAKKLDAFLPTPEYIRFFTPGNISVITGKAKSKKTFFQSMLASSLNNGNFRDRFLANIPKNKKNIITIDTEQSIYDVANVANRIKKLSNGNYVNLHNFSLRGQDHTTLIDFLKYILYEKIKNVSILFIDQVADLVQSLNDEKEAVLIAKLLEKITDELDIHICCMVHQNKLNDFAQGWLGTQLMKKAETVVKITKDVSDSNISYVEPDLLRGQEFEPFAFYIDDFGMPKLLENNEMNKNDIKPPF